MTHDDVDDRSLKRLTPLSPDPGRRARVLARCRAELERNTRRTNRRTAILGFTSRALVPALVGGFCLLYLAVLVAITVRLQSVVR